jgi:hypothetical protein
MLDPEVVQVRKPGSASNSSVWSTLTLPQRITEAVEFEKSVRMIRRAYTSQDADAKFIDRAYYLLGWMVETQARMSHPDTHGHEYNSISVVSTQRTFNWATVSWTAFP